MTKFSSTKIH